MQVKRIGFGYTKSLGNYENCKVWLEADLEDWEDPSQSLNLLRSQVAQELNLPDKWLDLKGKLNRLLRAIEDTNTTLEKSQEKLKKAQEAWKKYAGFLEAHGVDPESLVILPNSKSEEISRELIDRELDIAAKHLLPDLSPGEEHHRIQPIDFTSYINTSTGEKLAHELEVVKKLRPLPLNEDAEEEDNYFDPYCGDEYDRLHNSVDDDDY